MKPFIGQLHNASHPSLLGVTADIPVNEGQGGQVFEHCARLPAALTNFTLSAAWNVRESGPFIEFDGTNDHIVLPYRSLQTYDQGLTLVMHMYVSSTSVDKSAASQSSTSSATDGWWISIRDPSDSRPNAIQFSMNDSDFFSNNNAVPTNQWFWLGVSWHDGNVHFFIDGNEFSSVSTGGNTITNVAEPIRIGREFNFYTTSVYLDGGVGFFRMYNYGIGGDLMRAIVSNPYAAFQDFPSFRYEHIIAAVGDLSAGSLALLGVGR